MIVLRFNEDTYFTTGEYKMVSKEPDLEKKEKKEGEAVKKSPWGESIIACLY
jgi:hypothetical protein